ncbi:DUF4272 domain-containing protein [Wenyingzhuangia sp. chi5]|uniref:DUF4272 domain-containing protein n=1 Tax=Wenyingzhuangia gilva TaxID=3057677 RepID=A0ABT8VUQ6_9FLAO|nr:DUF4272 domain-containing protein [Wenyingzhuangia sp. chi5]MDO3695650.1 DUF4272 domain-containing protein [Wenyingzhuangia sp. chi5]
MNPEKLKIKSEKRIQSLGLEPNLNLPEIENLNDLKFKTGEQIAKRILSLAYLYGISFNASRKSIQNKLKEYGLIDELSNWENKILTKKTLTKQDKVNIDWVTESIEVLGWAIGLWSEIPLLNECNEDRQADNVPLNENPVKFITTAEIIPLNEIQEQADIIYRLHWIAKRTEIGKIGKHSNDVYMERHKAINWIIGLSKDWDTINTDT